MEYQVIRRVSGIAVSIACDTNRGATGKRFSTGDNGSVPVPEASLSPAQRRVRKLRRNAVGDAIREARTAAGITQAVLAELSGVSRPAIARIETGTTSVQIDRLWELAAALQTTPSAILAAAEANLNESAD